MKGINCDEYADEMGGKCILSTCWIFFSTSAFNRTLNNCNKVSKKDFSQRTTKNIYRSVKLPLPFTLKEEISKEITLTDMIRYAEGAHPSMLLFKKLSLFLVEEEGDGRVVCAGVISLVQYCRSLR